MPSELLDVPGCVERVRDGDDDAARALVDHMYPLVLKIVRAHRPYRRSEEDLAQDVFLKMFTRLEQYRPREGAGFEHWLARITVTTCLDALRSEKRRPEWRWADLSEEERAWSEYLAATEKAPEPASALGTREIIEKLLSFLSPDDRLVITLLDLSEQSVAEISALTGWSKALVKVRAFRARQKLRKHARQLQEESKL